MMRRAVAVVALWAVLAWPADAKGDAAGLLERVKERLATADAAGVLQALDAGDFAATASDEAALLLLTSHVESHVDGLTRRDGESTAVLLARLVSAATARRASGADTWNTRWTWATAVSLEQQSLQQRGEPVDLARWKEATDLARANVEPGDRAVLEVYYLSDRLGRQAQEAGAPYEALLEQADATIDEVEAAGTKGLYLMKARARHYLYAARALHAHRRDKEARLAIDRGLEFIARASTDDESRPWLAVDHLDLIEFARLTKLDRKAEYPGVDLVAKMDLFGCRAPRAGSWQTDHAGNELQVLTVTQRDGENHDLRALYVMAYRHGVPLTTGGAQLRVEDTRALADYLLQGVDGSLFDEVSRRQKSVRARLHARGPSGHACAVEGLDDDGRPMRLTITVVSSKKLGYTLAFRQRDHERSEHGLDAWTWFLESIRIPK